MAIRILNGVSRWADPSDRSLLTVVNQVGKPVLDADLNLIGAVDEHARREIWRALGASGFVNPGQDFTFYDPVDPAFIGNAFKMAKIQAIVSGIPLTVEYTSSSTAGENILSVPSPPVHGGAAPDIKRSDLVFLEMWLAEVAQSPAARWTVTVATIPTAGDTLTFTGSGAPVILTASAGAPGALQFFQGANTTATATNLAAAIMNPANGLTGDFYAVASGNVVTITAIPSGVLGNAYTLVPSVPASLVIAQVQLGVDTVNKADQDNLHRHGNVLASLSVAVPEQIRDQAFGVESSRRVQVQYRIRAYANVDHEVNPDGFSSGLILAQGTTGSPVAAYPFIRADGASTLANSSAVAYGLVDSGLWIAGQGNQASVTALGSVDGFVYALPIALVARRNDAVGTGGFNPVSNTAGCPTVNHGGYANPHLGVAVPAGASDRPDGLFADQVAQQDIVDLRYAVPRGAWDTAQELRRQVEKLLDDQNRTFLVDTEAFWQTGSGSGDISTRPVQCDEIGRAPTASGAPPSSGNTGRGEVLRNFDHVARTFSDRPVVERFVLPFTPTGATAGKSTSQANPGYAGWAEDDVLTINLTALHASTDHDWDGAASYAGAERVRNFLPAGSQITDVNLWLDDGNYDAAVDQRVHVKQITGLGYPTVTVVLDPDDLPVTGGVPGETGTLQAGVIGGGTLALAANIANDYYNGWEILVTAGAGTGQSRKIASYVGATKVFTCTPNWSVPVDNTSVYRLSYRKVGDSTYDCGSPRRIFVEVEVTYPAGVGLTRTVSATVTPDVSVYPLGAIIENDVTQQPTDLANLLPPRFAVGRREARLEYQADDGAGGLIVDTIVSRTDLSLYPLHRLYGDAGVVGTYLVTDQVTTVGVGVDDAVSEFGSSSRLMVPRNPLSADQTLAEVKYYALEALPNFGAQGYQVSLYYRGVVPQTVGTKAGLPNPTIPTSVTATVLASLDLGLLQAGAGSHELSFPSSLPGDWIPTKSHVNLPGDWWFDSDVLVELSDFSASVGSVELVPKVKIFSADSLTFGNVLERDAEFRTYWTNVTGGYRPTVLASPSTQSTRHKNWTAMLVRMSADSATWRAGEAMILVLSSWDLSPDNQLKMLPSNNYTVASIYRTNPRMLVP